MKKISGKKALGLVAGAIAAANLSMGAVNAEQEFDVFDVHFVCDGTGVHSTNGSMTVPKGELKILTQNLFWDLRFAVVSGDGWAEEIEMVEGIAVLRRNGIWYVANLEVGGYDGQCYTFDAADEVGGALRAYASEDGAEICIGCLNAAGRRGREVRIPVGGKCALLMRPSAPCEIERGICHSTLNLFLPLRGADGRIQMVKRPVEAGVDPIPIIAREIAARLNEMIAQQ